MGEFSDRVYKIVGTIPRGRVTTYGDVARAVGRPRAARFVGYALHDNPDPGEKTPCHRVVFKDGRVAPGFAFGGPEEQRRLLEAEGVQFLDDTHVDMATHHWAPDAPDGTARPADVDWSAEMAD